MSCDKEKKVFTPEQADRLMEDFETLVLSHKLQGQLLETFGRDYKGMINGNNKEVENEILTKLI